MFITRAFVTVVVMIGIAHSTFGEDQCGDFVGSDVVLNRERVTWYSEGFTGAGFPEISGTSKTCERTITSSKPFVVILHDVTKSNTWFLALVIDDGDPEEQNLVTGDERIITIATKVVVTYIQMATSAGDKFGISFLPTTPDDVCDGIKTIEATPTPKYITTENFPGYYEHNTVCQLTLTTTADYITAEIEWIKLAGQCGEDQLHVRLSPGSPRITLSCSDVISGARFTDVLEYKSIGKTMNIDFSSDFENSESGFRIKIYSNPYDTAPKVVKKCEYDSDTDQLRISLTITPGTYGMTETHLVDSSNNKLEADCGKLTEANKGADWVSEHVVLFSDPTNVFQNSFGEDSCPLTHEIYKDEINVVMRVEPKQLPGYTVGGDDVQLVRCTKEPIEQTISSAGALELPPVAQYEEFEAIMWTPEMRLQFVGADSLIPLTPPVSLSTPVRLMFTMINADAGKISGGYIAARLHSCKASSLNTYPDDSTFDFIGNDGCLPASTGTYQPFRPATPFNADPTADGYDVDQILEPGTKFVSVSGKIHLALKESDPQLYTLYAKCLATLCKADDPACFSDTCSSKRKRRSADGSHAEKNAGEMVETVIILERVKFQVVHGNSTTENTPQTAEVNCMDTTIFAAVTVVLAITLLLAILVSSCLLFQMKSRNYKE